MLENKRGNTDIPENNCVIEVDQFKNVVEKIKQYEEKGTEERIINVNGVGGVGKTTLLKRIRGIYEDTDLESDEETAKIIKDLSGVYYIEASACSTDVEILYLIARSVRDTDGKGKSVLKKYEVLYQCYKMAREQKFAVQTEDMEKKMEDACGILEKIAIPAVELTTQVASSGNVMDILSSVMQTNVVMKAIADGISAVTLIRAILKKYKIRNDEKAFLHMIEQYNSDYEYRRALKMVFVEESKDWLQKKEKQKYVFIIDNYALTYTRELYYDRTWIKTISHQIKGFWIIGSRSPIEVGEDIDEVKLTGFNQTETKQYIENYIPKKCMKDYTDEEKSKIRKRIAETCEEGKDIYLPYKLRLVCDYVIRRSNENVVNLDELVKPEMDEFVSYYFFSDMPEMVIAAVQLLSCLSAWTSRELEILRQKFNYHYLEARYLLQKCASVESLSNGEIKLHEAIKDAVNQNGGNYIIFDAEEYLFHKLGELFLDSTSDIIDIRLVKDYFEIACDYIRRIHNDKNTEKYEQVLAEFMQLLEKIYRIHIKDEFITEAFELAYGAMIKTVFGKYCNDELLYCKQKLLWADLCTRLYKTDTAQNIEAECVQKIEEIKIRVNNKKQEVECGMLLIKAYNWAGNDSSKSWDYEKAWEYGCNGLKAADSLTEMIIREIEESRTCREEDTKQLVEKLKVLKTAYSGQKNVSEQNSIFPEGNHSDDNYSYCEIKEAFEYITKMIRQNENDADEEMAWYLKKLKDLFTDQYVKLRGNLPWYMIRTESEDNDVIRDPVQYGISTYWIRKAIGKESLARTSMKNIVAYMYKGHDTQTNDYHAMLILQELIEQCQAATPYTIRQGTTSELRKQELEGGTQLVRESDEDSAMFEHLAFLYKKASEQQNTQSLSALWSTSNEALEPLSYLGELYLIQHWYRDSLFKFTVVLINRYVRTEVFKSEMLDAYCRCGIALYGLGEKKMAMEFLGNMCRIAASRSIECPKGKQENYVEMLKIMEQNKNINELISILKKQ